MRIRPLLLVLVTVACRGGESAPQRNALVDSRDTYDPRSLDPALSTDVPTGRAVSYVFDGLTRFTPDARVEPGLAERWDVSPDGLTYTFHLRRGVAFHNGESFSARHVLHTFERALDPATKGGRAEPLAPIKGSADFAAGRASSVSGLAARDDSDKQQCRRTQRRVLFATFAQTLATSALKPAGRRNRRATHPQFPPRRHRLAPRLRTDHHEYFQ